MSAFVSGAVPLATTGVGLLLTKGRGLNHDGAILGSLFGAATLSGMVTMTAGMELLGRGPGLYGHR